MSDAPADARERAELCDLMLAVGPDAPTLCEGWSTLDLAAHLVIRERDPRGGLVILGGERFADLESKLMGKAAGQGLPALVERLRSGPPAFPWRLPVVRTALNLIEWYVHHEDVRRAGGAGADAAGPRTDRPDLDEALWALLRRSSRFLLARAKGVRVTLSAPGHGDLPARGDGPDARLVGSPQELVLYLNGRRSVARVEIDAPPDAAEALSTAKLGI